MTTQPRSWILRTRTSILNGTTASLVCEPMGHGHAAQTTKSNHESNKPHDYCTAEILYNINKRHRPRPSRDPYGTAYAIRGMNGGSGGLGIVVCQGCSFPPIIDYTDQFTLTPHCPSRRHHCPALLTSHVQRVLCRLAGASIARCGCAFASLGGVWSLP